MFPSCHCGAQGSDIKHQKSMLEKRVTEISAECCIQNGFSIKTGLINGVRCLCNVLCQVHKYRLDGVKDTSEI